METIDLGKLSFADAAQLAVGARVSCTHGLGAKSVGIITAIDKSCRQNNQTLEFDETGLIFTVQPDHGDAFSVAVESWKH
jgi:hypothetical protein